MSFTPIRILVFLVVLSATYARATLLLNESFSTETDGRGAYPYQETSLKNQTADAYTIGLSPERKWVDSGSSVLYSLPNDGLSFPASFSGFTAHSGAAGFHNGQASAETSMRRGIDRLLDLDSPLPTTGTIYYRCLMRTDSVAMGYLKKKAWTYHGFGLSTNTLAELKGTSGSAAYSFAHNLANHGFRIGFQSINSSQIDIRASILGTSYIMASDITAGTTYLCVLAFDLDADRVFSYCTPIADYSPNFVWTELQTSAGVPATAAFASHFKNMFFAGEYGTDGGVTAFDEVALGNQLSDVVQISSSAPLLSDESFAHNSSTDTYTASAILSQCAATVSYVLSDGTTDATNAVGSFTIGSTVTATFPAPTDGKTYEARLIAVNAGGESADISLGTLYGGVLSLVKLSDASEEQLIPATLSVSRTSADPLPLTVNYTLVDDLAISGRNYVNDSGSVTIPAGATSATITVSPLLDTTINADTSLFASLAMGNYTVPDAVSVTIANFATPTGYNIWVAKANSDGQAFTPSNWSQGHTPTASEIVILDGLYSSMDMNWQCVVNGTPTGLSDTVAGWAQSNGCGTVTFRTTYPSQGTFNRFTIQGDASILGGHWVHPYSRHFSPSDKVTAEKCATGGNFRLDVAVTGNLTLAKNCNISGQGRGAQPGDAVGSVSAALYGTHGGTHTGSWPSYGSVFHPTSIGGIGSQKGTDLISKYAAGGGSVQLTVGGDFLLNGRVTVNGATSSFGRGGAGSVWITVGGALIGTGSIEAHGEAVSDSQGSGGGRIAVYADTIATNTLSISAKAAYNRSGGAGSGTVYLQDGASADKAGIVRIDAAMTQNSAHASQITPLVPQLSEGGDSPADFRNVSVEVAGGARMLADNVEVRSISIPSPLSKIDLHGCTIRTKSLFLAGEKIYPGTYTADSALTDGYLIDTVGDGRLIVVPSFTFIQIL